MRFEGTDSKSNVHASDSGNNSSDRDNDSIRKHDFTASVRVSSASQYTPRRIMSVLRVVKVLVNAVIVQVDFNLPVTRPISGQGPRPGP